MVVGIREGRCRAETAAVRLRRRRRCGPRRAARAADRGEGAGADIYRGAETHAGSALSHMLIGYLRRIFLDVTVHATPMPSERPRSFRPINIDTYVTGLDTKRLTRGHLGNMRLYWVRNMMLMTEYLDTSKPHYVR